LAFLLGTGVTTGVFLNTMFSDTVLKGALFLFLVVSVARGVKKIRKLKTTATPVADTTIETTENQMWVRQDRSQPEGSPGCVQEILETAGVRDRRQALAEILVSDAKIPYSKLITLVAIWCGLLVLNCMRGSKNWHSFVGIKNCSVLWMCVNVFIYVFLIMVTKLLGVQLLKDYSRRVELNFPFQPGDCSTIDCSTIDCSTSYISIPMHSGTS
jgi:hypothetical protein